jgi:hypothetical protein
MPDLIRHPGTNTRKNSWIPGQARNDETEAFIFLKLRRSRLLGNPEQNAV